MREMMRSRLFTIAAGFALCVAAGAKAETLVFAGPGGSWQKIMQPLVIKPFEKQCGCTVRYRPGSSNENLARVIATKDNPEIDVMYSGNLQQIQGAAQGLFLPLDTKAMPNLANVWPNLRDKKNTNAFLGVIGGGFAYNTKIFKEHNLAPPTSIKDMLRPAFKGRLVIEGAYSNYGIGMLVLMAEVNGGGVNDIEPGFAFAKKVAPSVVVFARKTTDTSRALQQGTAWIAWWGDVRARTLAATGFPLKWVPVKEGIPPIIMGASVVKGTKSADTGFRLVDYLLSKDVQELLADKLSIGPTVKNADLPKEVGDRVIYGPEEVGKLMDIDWLTVAKHKAEWIDRWNREVQGRK
ncbi:MAG: extracellular solute-binding protein [Alphaproteobacteria bacterium]|nr:extracellular solute-binding protein [Alphaproteobacteria bacterium]